MRKITNREVQQMWRTINAIMPLESSPKFSYTLVVMRKRIVPVIEALAAAQAPPDAYTEYDKKRLELCRERAEKDDKGKPQMAPGESGALEYVIQDMEAFNAEVEAMKVSDAHREAVEAYTKQLEDYEKLRDEEADVALMGLRFEDIPEGVTTAHMMGLQPLLEAGGAPPLEPEAD